jgi:alkylation response protein AidB-like acyl-CoA dehydrogenase
MDFELSTEQVLLNDSLEQFLRTHSDAQKRRTSAVSVQGFCLENWSRFSAMGWLGLPLPESVGGLGGTAVETGIVMEGFGRWLVCEPYLATILLGAKLIERAGSEEQKLRWLPEVIDGRTLLSFAHSEPQARYELNDVETRALRTDQGYLIDGRKSVVSHASSADAVIVSARTSGDSRERSGISLFFVDCRSMGISRVDYRTLDGRRASDLTLRNVMVPAQALLGDAGGAIEIIEEVVDHAICAICAEAVGAMRAVIDMTREYIGIRQQFGVPIATNQVLRHRLVDMHIAAEESKSMSDMAAMRMSADPAERRMTSAAAKAKIGIAARFVGEQAIQLHGGIGMTDQHPVGHYYKRLACIDTWFGSSDFHLKRFSAL